MLRQKPPPNKPPAGVSGEGIKPPCQGVCLAATEIRLIIKESQGPPHYLFTPCFRCKKNTFVVAVGSIGEEVEELVDGRVGAVLQLRRSRGRADNEVVEHTSNEALRV